MTCRIERRNVETMSFRQLEHEADSLLNRLGLKETKLEDARAQERNVFAMQIHRSIDHLNNRLGDVSEELAQRMRDERYGLGSVAGWAFLIVGVLT